MIQRIVLLTEYELQQLADIAKAWSQDIDFVIRSSIGRTIADQWKPRERTMSAEELAGYGPRPPGAPTIER